VADINLGPAEELAWIFPPRHDLSLYHEATFFFSTLRRSGELERIIERYYGHDTALDYVHMRRFIKHIASRLPEYEPLFVEAAREHQQDWRLLAALSYQESWWDPKARSPTGVRGMMMLTRTTARELGVKDRLDPFSSIEGGARYLASLHSRIPQRIIEPDRTWLALTAYNIGMGHMEDARRLTQAAGDNPDHWVDVKKHLPLLSRKKWYRKTRFGHARGHEALQYVERIRSYYDLLVRHTEGTLPRANPMPASSDNDSES
jgi:membrane-bound lytic murein transglycosylase F